MIELGRYNNTPRDNRLCPVCDCNKTEDEIHFFYCSKYATIRDNFYKKIQPFVQNVSRLPVPELTRINELFQLFCDLAIN